MNKHERLEHEYLELLLVNCTDLEYDERSIYIEPSTEDYKVIRGEDYYMVWARDQPITELAMDALQGAIQGAIALLGYEFCLKSFVGGYQAQITAERSRGETFWEATAERAAIALLAVYVACLKSVDSEGETDERL